MDVRVLEHTTEGPDSVALLEQSHPGGPVLYLVTIVVLVTDKRRPPRRFTFARCDTDRSLAEQLYHRAVAEFLPEPSFFGDKFD